MYRDRGRHSTQASLVAAAHALWPRRREVETAFAAMNNARFLSVPAPPDVAITAARHEGGRLMPATRLHIEPEEARTVTAKAAVSAEATLMQSAATTPAESVCSAAGSSLAT